MFSRKDTSFDLAAEMEKNLRAFAEAEVAAPINKIASAIDYLNRAAEIFDESGLHMEAEIATRLLEVFAAKKAKKKSKKKPSKSSKKPAKKPSKTPTKKPAKTDEATKNLDSEKMVDNLKEKGWVFNADDGQDDDMNFAAAHEEGCNCSMCFDGNMADDDNFAQPGMPMDDAMYEKDEHEQELARMMNDLEDASHAEQEMHDFEDDGEGMLPSNDNTRAPHYFRSGDDR